ncbi:methyl-accepting chemotaxis protein [Pelagibacterium sp. 26DY04]|uniref:methyl-accepting chemotaxis protein n=1 Tax=Pelagibacterium sp. 26DY04 TaxID=2967130 RepID=UPI002816218D|nr:methyl-accepting chemotaxis protein [Pelagibacterium sp. 26DY04]WMT87277.1 methyl-accepting chemotaxis protein [Pelagibacterium sp. 26DY04]
MRSSVANRVYAAFGAIIGLMLCLLLLAVTGMQSTRSSLQGFSEAAGRVTTATEVLDHLETARLAFAQYDRTRAPEDAVAVEQALDVLQTGQNLAGEDGELFAQYAEQTAAILDRDATAQAARAEMERLGAAATATLGELIAQTSQSANLNARAAAISGLAIQHVLTARLAATGLEDDQAEMSLADATQASQAALTTLADLRSVFYRTDDIARVDETITATQSYLDQLDIVRDAFSLRAADQVEHDRIDEALATAYSAVVADAAALQAEAGTAAQRQAESTQWLAILLGGAILVLSAGLAIAMARWISHSVRRTAEAMEGIAGGDLESEIALVSQATEFRQMTQALVVFRDNGRAMRAMDSETEAARRSEAEANALRQTLQSDIQRVVAAASDGDFSARIEHDFGRAELDALAGSVNALVETVDRGIGETGAVLNALAADDLSARMTGHYRGAFDRLKTDTNALAERFASVVAQMQASAGTLKAATQEILSGAHDLSARTARQAATIEETAASMEQLAATVSANARRAEDMAGSAESAAAMAGEGEAVMLQATDAMGRITKSAEEIASIVKLIDDIAFQTNLLALNASVEAARAGEAGKGFAVVAVEVRRLAQSASQAGDEIKQLIAQSGREVEDGSKLVAEAARRLAAIMAMVTENASTMTEMSAASRDQAGAIQSVSAAVRELDVITQQNAALVEKTNAAVAQTDAQARDLDAIVESFQLSPAETDEFEVAPLLARAS